MKYIRTKEGVFDFYHDGRVIERNHLKDYYFDDETSLSLMIDHGKIIKKANTIEELCDEFVVVDERCGHRIALLSGIRPQGLKLYTYGAIWTDKGLIYVAKMNDKGELELI